MKLKTNNITKGIVFAGCSFTWGQGLYYYSNMSTLKESLPNRYHESLVTDAHNMFRKTLYYPRLVANHFNTFEISMIQNGGSDETSFKYLKNAFGLINPSIDYVKEKYYFDEIEYIIFQTSEPRRNIYHYNYINTDGSIDEYEYGTFAEKVNDNKFIKYLIEQKKCTMDEWFDEHTKNWFQQIKQNLEFYESKNIKTFVLNWQTDYNKYFITDEWMQNRLIKFNYNNIEYNTIRDMMDKNKNLCINFDYKNFEIPPKDQHPSKECHRVIAGAVIKKIEETKYLNETLSIK